MLVDFGVSKESVELISEKYYSSNTYMAPEVFKGDFNEKVDVYSLAVILYKMLQRSHPDVQALHKG